VPRLIDNDALASLAIFPLPDAVLLPGSVLPLHVFEQRYRDMMGDVLDGDPVLAIARLRPGYEHDYQGRPPVFATAGVGRVVSHDLLEDGRYNILVQGLGRVRIENELPPQESYRRVRARLLTDDTSRRPDEVIATHTQLLALCERVADSLGDTGEQLRELLQTTDTPAECADVIGAALLTSPDARQDLLEALDPADRLDAVVQHVARLARKLGTKSGMLH
jgi:Lon protease-like protein